mmetsp:Transcript_30933/g.67820  ORF Transcript_30933/g.67820 Transcript_30933/m.67820 type:complete len:341 (-) Transcript_30933:1929-2951(-)
MSTGTRTAIPSLAALPSALPTACTIPNASSAPPAARRRRRRMATRGSSARLPEGTRSSTSAWPPLGSSAGSSPAKSTSATSTPTSTPAYPPSRSGSLLPRSSLTDRFRDRGALDSCRQASSFNVDGGSPPLGAGGSPSVCCQGRSWAMTSRSLTRHATSAQRRPIRTARPRPPSAPSLSRANSNDELGRTQPPPSALSALLAPPSRNSRVWLAKISTRGPSFSATLAVPSQTTSTCKMATRCRTDDWGCGAVCVELAATASSSRPSNCLSSHSRRKVERKAQTTLPRPAEPWAHIRCKAASNGRASCSERRPSFPFSLVRATRASTSRDARTCIAHRAAS